MKKYSKITAILMALTMTAGVLAGCGGKEDQKGSDVPQDTSVEDQQSEEGTEEAEPTYEYTWDITVNFPEISVENGDVDPGVTVSFTNPGFDDWDDAYKNQRFQFTRENNTAEMKIMDESDWIVDNSQDWYKWIFDDEDFGYRYSFEVITPLTKGDEETHGELEITLKNPDYFWDITVSYENGAEGEYMLTNPGLDGWDEAYMNQRFTFTPEENTAVMAIMDPSDWEVSNTEAWYQWVVNDVNDEGGTVTFEITEHLERNNFVKHGALTVHITK